MKMKQARKKDKVPKYLQMEGQVPQNEQSNSSGSFKSRRNPVANTGRNKSIQSK